MHSPEVEDIMKTKVLNTNAPYYYKIMESPIGPLRLVASNNGLAGILWKTERPGRVNLAPQIENLNHPILLKTQAQLNDYFSGKRTSFDLPLDFKGTAFQKEVWNYLVHIPFGETRTYGGMAKDLGRPKAMRAVGAANGRNPISIIAGCHRVIGANGSLTGFAGGLEAKSFLLTHENKAFACG
jgi:methylated-DNA-[protein]-cysteine S-methyltransferase